MRILLFGKNGQVGWELQRTLAPLGEVIAVGRKDADFIDLKGLRRFTLEVMPDLIVNAAAYTAVDKAESEPEIAMRVNGEAPGVLAEVAKKLGVGLVHYSTDYVFDGAKREPYTEEDEPNPINVYGETKLAGERAIQESGCAYIILRTSWVYGTRGKNFFLKILRLAREREVLKIVDDQIGCPTWCKEIAKTTSIILAETAAKGKNIEGMVSEMQGIYNYSSADRASWFEFAVTILDSDPKNSEHTAREVIPIRTMNYPTPARRPAFSVLSKIRLERVFGIEPVSWEEQLRACWQSIRISEQAPDQAASHSIN